MPMPSIHDFKKARVAIVGDSIRDRWIYGRYSKISAEGTPVFVPERIVDSPGGAANVQANLNALGVPRAPLYAHYPCSIKTRYVVGGHHILRVDEDEIHSPSLDFGVNIVRDLTSFAPQVLVISDYAKGVCTSKLCQQLIKWANEHSIKVVVDPKGKYWQKYEGAYIITPNEREAEERIYGAGKHLLITRGAKGMDVTYAMGFSTHIPALKVEPKDVTGCGDSVVAALAASLAVGFPLEEAARIANAAGGVAVSHAGTHAVTIEELEAVL